VADLYEKYMALMTRPRTSIVLTRLLDHLFENWVVSTSDAAKVMGVSYTAAQRHVELLVKSGVLHLVGKDRYGKFYLATAILRAIQGKGEP
jgi:predicted ArsR family transcriptional regulator